MIKYRRKFIPSKMHVKSGDTVVVLSGKDKGTVGEIIKSYPKVGMVVVEGVNIKVKHVKQGPDGKSGMFKVPRPIPSSKVMFYSKDNKQASRLGRKTLEDGKKVRYMKKNEEIV